MDKASINAQAFSRTALAAKARGFRPDVVMADAGWGAGMFARAVFPDAVSVPLVEWFYNTPAPDAAALDRLSTRPTSRPYQPMLQAGRNAPILMDMAMAQAAICPTPFQAAQFPDHPRRFLSVIHDGIDTDIHAPDPVAASDTLDGLVPGNAPVVTYATRGMEPHRGFPPFIRALPAVLEARPDAHVVILGENRVAHGDRAIREVDWKARLLGEVALPEGRIHFMGFLPRPMYRRVLLRSSAQFYLTVPFVLSWSMLEATCCGCLLVASDTWPVIDFARDNINALLVEHDEVPALAERILAALDAADGGRALRRAARQTILETAASTAVWPRKHALLERLMSNCHDCLTLTTVKIN